MQELRPLVPVLVEKDLAQLYASAAGVINLRALLAEVGNDVMTFGNGAPGGSVETPLYWDLTGLILYINDTNLGWTVVVQLGS